eukprot:1161198-Pelagomonas_calceolata.AAC.2
MLLSCPCRRIKRDVTSPHLHLVLVTLSTPGLCFPTQYTASILALTDVRNLSINLWWRKDGAERGHVFRFSHEDVKGAKEQGQDKEDEEGKDTPSAFVGSRNQLMHGIRAAQH